jgi:hypothetical protein
MDGWPAPLALSDPKRGGVFDPHRLAEVNQKKEEGSP